MPHYVGEYLATTGTLTTEEHGAYFLLIMHYWVHESLPDDEKSLAILARLSLRKWQAMQPKIKLLFGPNWSHQKLTEDIDKAKDISSKRAAAGRLGRQTNGHGFGEH